MNAAFLNLALVCLTVGTDPFPDPSTGSTADSQPASAHTPARKSGFWPWSKRSTDAAENADAGEKTRGLGHLFQRRLDPPSDSVLRIRCQNLVFADRELRNSSIRIGVQRGVVKLEGTVTSLILSQRAERLARRTPEIKEVNNLLAIAVERRSQDRYAAVRLSRPILIATADQERMPHEERNVLNSSAAQPPKPRSQLVQANRVQSSRDQVVVDHPQSVLVSPDLPRVVMYTIRRPKEKPLEDLPAENRSVLTGQPQFTADETRPRRRPGLVPRAPAATATELPMAETAAPPPAEHPAIDEILQRDARAQRLRYSVSGRNVTLFGETASTDDLLAVVGRLGDLPEVGSVTIDRQRLQIDQ